MKKVSKAIRKKVKRPKKEKGEAKSYKEIHKERKSMRKIRGVFNAYKAAPKIGLMLNANLDKKMYLDGNKEILTIDKESARIFREGFDDLELKRKFWSDKLKVNLITVRL